MSDRSSEKFSDADLEAYLDESLNAAKAAEIEQAARDDKSLLERLAHINARRDAGMHSLGEIWRRNQVGVPSPEQMQDYVAGKLGAEEADYIDFRIETLQCPFTIALKEDVDSSTASDSESKARRDRLYQSSAGLLKKKK